MSLNLKAQKREKKEKKAAKLRAAGLLPAVIYGPEMAAQPVTVAKPDFLRVFHKAGETRPITIELGRKELQVLVHDIQEHPISGDILHIDFYHVSGKKPIRTFVPVELIGQSPVVKNNEGVLVTQIRELEVEARLPDLPKEITGSLTALVKLHDELRVKDLNIPAGVKVIDHDPEDIVATVVPLRKAEKEVSPEEQEVIPADVKAQQPGEGEAGAQEPAQQSQSIEKEEAKEL